MYKFARYLPLLCGHRSEKGGKIMNKRLFFRIVVVLSIVGMVGCSSYNKLLKRNDADEMFHAAIDYYNGGDYEKALQLFDELAPRYASTMRADTIMYYTGCCFYKRGDFSSSATIFDEYRRTYGRSPLLEDVEYMYAMGFYFASPEATRDQTATMQAIRAIGEYMERYPETLKKPLCEMRLEELQGKLYDKSFYNARTYYKTRRYKAAIIAFRNALDEYPTTPHREEILYLMLESSYELASNSIASLQVDRYLDTMDAYYNLMSEFPDTKHKRSAERIQRQCKSFLAKHNVEGVDESADEGYTTTQAGNTNL